MFVTFSCSLLYNNKYNNNDRRTDIRIGEFNNNRYEGTEWYSHFIIISNFRDFPVILTNV